MTSDLREPIKPIKPFQVSSIKYQVSSIKCQVSSVKCQVQNHLAKAKRTIQQFNNGTMTSDLQEPMKPIKHLKPIKRKNANCTL